MAVYIERKNEEVPLQTNLPPRLVPTIAFLPTIISRVYPIHSETAVIIRIKSIVGRPTFYVNTALSPQIKVIGMTYFPW